MGGKDQIEPLTHRCRCDTVRRAERETGEIKWKTQRPRDRELETERQEMSNEMQGQKHTQAGKQRF